MKKIFKSRIFTFVLGAIIFGSIGSVVAYNYNAKDVSYTPNDISWNVNNVEDAIKDLYSKTSFLDKTIDVNPVPSSNSDSRIIVSSYDTTGTVSSSVSYNAFDRTGNTWWTSALNGGFPQYIGWDFESKVKVFKFSIKNRSDYKDTAIGQFVLQGFDDNNWLDIQNYNHTTAEKGAIEFFYVTTPKLYQKYRIKILNELVRNANYVQLDQLDFYYIK